jgi:hypothetical protein
MLNYWKRWLMSVFMEFELDPKHAGMINMLNYLLRLDDFIWSRYPNMDASKIEKVTDILVMITQPNSEVAITDWLLEIFLRVKNPHTGSSLDSAFDVDELSEMDQSLKCMEIIKKHNEKSSIFNELKISVKQGVKIAKKGKKK